MLVKVLLAVGAASVVNGLGPSLTWAAAENAAVSAVATQCNGLASAELSGILDAPTQIMEVKLVEAAASVPTHCQVLGYIAPQIGFDLRLPISRWNGKFLEVGCHSYCGLMSIPGDDCSIPLRKGYACITTDMGHKGPGFDGLWAYNNLQAKLDWGYRSTHVVALAGKAISTKYYGKAPAHSYFIGWSAGTRQGMVEAQRFPWDFDGIIAGTGQIDWTGAMMTAVWHTKVSQDKDGHPFLRTEDFQLLHDAVMAKCDLDDGVRDGIISDPRSCSFDPSELLCRLPNETGCLSEAQVETIKSFYAGPMTSKGERIYEDGAMMPGSELSWEKWLFLGSSLGSETFRYLGFASDPGSSWNVGDFDFDRDYKRLGTMEALYTGSNPDLRTFKAAGGKLICWQGWAEVPAPPLSVVHYYETVEKLLGGRRPTQDFFRLFMIPGLGHTGSEGGINLNTIDYLSYLEDWVENGKAPDKVVGARMITYELSRNPKLPLDPKLVRFTRPVYPYPVRAKYKGTGDPNKAENFEPEEP